MRETVTKEASQYHFKQKTAYLQQGLSEEEAEERADIDLIEWSKPINMGPTNMPQEQRDAFLDRVSQFEDDVVW